MTTSFASIARALGGDVAGNQVVCPGPGHSKRDRSLSVTLSPTAPDGLLVHSFGRTDHLDAKDYVRARLGFPAFQPRRPLCSGGSKFPRATEAAHPQALPEDSRAHLKISAARRIADEMLPWSGTVVERYLHEERGLALDACISDLGFHPQCPWRDSDGRLIRVPAMIGAMRSLKTERVVAVHRTRLSADGRKVDRRMLGPTAGTAIMLCPFSAIGAGITIAEGIETALSGWQIGWSNVWALGSAGAIASFPVLAGVQSLVALCENDEANRRAVNTVAERYDAAGREVILVHPTRGNDLNDVIREVPA